MIGMLNSAASRVNVQQNNKQQIKRKNISFGKVITFDKQVQQGFMDTLNGRSREEGVKILRAIGSLAKYHKPNPKNDIKLVRQPSKDLVFVRCCPKSGTVTKVSSPAFNCNSPVDVIIRAVENINIETPWS